MFETKQFDSLNKLGRDEKERVVNFLFENLQEYGDPKPDIEKAIDYALQEVDSFGGFVLVAFLGNEIVGAVVVNQTGMEDYIPENILVYIAIHQNHRGKGFGKMLLQNALDMAKGNVALHVEPENPAKFLYEKIGFASKYVEMRYKKA